MTKLEAPEEYVELAEIYFQFAVKCISLKEAAVVAGDVVRRMKTNEAFKAFQSQLGFIARTLLSGKLGLCRDALAVDLLTDKTVRKGVRRSLLLQIKTQSLKVTSVPVAQALLDVARTVHDLADPFGPERASQSS